MACGSSSARGTERVLHQRIHLAEDDFSDALPSPATIIGPAMLPYLCPSAVRHPPSCHLDEFTTLGR